MMNIEEKVRILQLTYAAALADATLRMGRDGILPRVTAEKRREQMANGRVRAAQFGIRRPEEVFQKLVEGRDLSAAEPYSIKTPFQVSDLIDHPKFGVGVVTAIADVQKVKVVFEDGERVMVCNRS